MFNRYGRRFFSNGRWMSSIAMGSTSLTTSSFLGFANRSPAVRCEEEFSPEEKRTMRIFEKCSPSVVHITTQLDLATNWFEIARIDSGSGSGFIWDTAGHIVTNYHVIRNSTRASVTLFDQTVLEAELVGAEPDVDVAVLKVDVSKLSAKQKEAALKTNGGTSSGSLGSLSPVTVGKSSKLRVGQRVFAIGNPFGLDQSLSSGVVSGVGRQIDGVGGRPIKNVIQTDATINPGNSGGPLLDGSGNLIGINTMIASQTGGWSGVGFAVPSDTVARTVNQIIKYGRTIRPWLGVSLAPGSVKLGGGKTPLEGVLVISVQVGSPAYAAGIRGTARDPYNGSIIFGDEIVKVNDNVVTDPEEVSDIIEAANIGDVVTLKIKRDGNKYIDVSITLQDRPSVGLAIKRRSRL